MMNKKFDHLVWLGAGCATEPEGLLANAEYVILIEPREAAFNLLADQKNKKINVQKLLLSADGALCNFTEYNLPEFSATLPLDGLNTLFPGINAHKIEQIQSIKISDFILGLQLKNNNNLLVMDIPDSNLSLLKILFEYDLLHYFSEIYIQASHIPLYQSSATYSEIHNFFELKGYISNKNITRDPDFPWLNFVLNPLWFTLKKNLDSKNALEYELERVRVSLNEATAQYTALKEESHLQLKKFELSSTEALFCKDEEIGRLMSELELSRTQLSCLEKQINETNHNYQRAMDSIQRLEIELSEKSQALHASELQLNEKATELTDALQQMEKRANARLDTISQLEKSNRSLFETNKNLTMQQKVIADEMLKVEAQMDLIKDIFFKS